MAAIPLENEIFYPESDGEPMAETEVHLDEMIYAREALRDYFAAAPDVYVGANMLFYYEEGRRDAVVAPDAFVVMGIPKTPRRRKFLLWEEGQSPCFVLEVTSRSTRKKDLEQKKSLYQRLGVDEYFLFDPLGEYLKPRLQGYRLSVGGRYRALQPEPDGSLNSEALGLTVRPEETGVRWIDTKTGKPLLRHEEEVAARREAEERAAQAEERLRALEEEIARLRGAS